MTMQNVQLSDCDLPLPAYENAFEYIRAELALLDLKLKRELFKRKLPESMEAMDSKAFFVSEEEILSRLSVPAFDDEKGDASNDIASISLLIKDKEEEIKARSAEGNKEEDFFPLIRLAHLFQLTEFEKNIIITALAPDLDVKYERIYAYFNDDLNKRAVSVDMVLKLHLSDRESMNLGRSFFSNESKLFQFRLLHFINNHEEESFLNRRIKLDEGIRAFLLGDAAIHPLLSGLATLSYPVSTVSGNNEALAAVLREAVKCWMKVDSSAVISWLYGEVGDERESIIALLGREFNLPVISADLEEIMLASDPVMTIKLLCREAFLRSSVLYFKGGDKLGQKEGVIPLVTEALLKTIEEYSWFLIVSAQNMWVPDNLQGRCRWIPAELKLPAFEERLLLWGEAFGGKEVSLSDLDIVASRFSFSENRIRKVADYAKHLAGEKVITLDILLKACNYQSTEKITKYSKKIKPHYSWDDLVLPTDKVNHLKEICNVIKNKHTVFYKWGFDEKLALGRGVNMLFSGPSGTGKTMTADIIASELRLDLYKTDLSCLVSKYIGETEKNLGKIFNEASSGSAILFFDEADALFGKRSEVKDAHDRYANIEINYLLQKIEEHEGVVILSTNFSNNIDEAFLRRMNALVEFPFPDEMHRELIWKKIFPQMAPLSKEIDYQFLAQKINVAGGNIKNMALAGAFLAADEDSDIRMCHLINAVKREFEKMGKPFMAADFEKYLDGDRA